MRASLSFLRVLPVLFVGVPGVLLAHGDVDARIASVTARIEAEPEDLSLYLRRAMLHAEHEDLVAALADLAHVQDEDPERGEVDYLLGKVHAELGEPVDALAPLDRFLAAEPEHVNARVVRARVLEGLGRREEAHADYTAAIGASAEPPVGIYVERARLFAERDPERALRGLLEGIDRAGPLMALMEAAVRIEEGRGHMRGALELMDRLPPEAAGSPPWLLRKGDAHRAVGERRAAALAYDAARAAI